jgi:hypothetical protein
VGAEIPNGDLVKRLFREHYQAEGEAGDPIASSHWQYLSELFDVRLDARGMPISLQGVGFGHAQWGNPLHQLFDRLCIASHLRHLRHRRAVRQLQVPATEICRKMGLQPTFDAVFRQTCVLALLQEHIGAFTRRDGLRVLLIGDGFGVFASLFKRVYPDAQMTLVDLGKTLLFQTVNCQRAHPDLQHLHAESVGAAEADFVYCPAEALESLEGPFDIAVNVCSMQEMSSEVIAGYFGLLREHLRSEHLFYCCNRERNVLRGGEVSEFLAYPWESGDSFLADELCPWQRYFFHWTRTAHGLEVLGVRVPFVNYYDGRIIHRLAVLAT